MSSLLIAVPENNQKLILDTPLVNPLVKFHGHFIEVFTKKCPPKKQFIDMLSRIGTLVVAPFAYIALSFLALVGAIKYALCCSGHKVTEKVIKKVEKETNDKVVVDDSYAQFSIETYGVVKKRLSLLSDAEVKFLRKEGLAEEKIQEKQNRKEPVYIQMGEENEKQELFATKTLGKGGAKRAIQLSDGNALLIPNMDVDPLDDIQERWPRMVEEEIQMGEFLSSIGLFSLEMRKVKLFLEKDSTSYIPAYVARSFETLKEDGIFIIDRKNSESTTLKAAPQLFKDIQEISNPQNWKPYVQLLIKDIAKLIHYKLPLGGDSFNVALVKAKDGSLNLRYLGFDFSSKGGRRSIPTLEKPALSKYEINSEDTLIKAKEAFSNALEEFFFQTYKVTVGLPVEAKNTLKKIREAFSNDLKEAILTFTADS